MTTSPPADRNLLADAAADLAAHAGPRVERTPAVHHDELLFSIPMRVPDTVRFRVAEPGVVRIELAALSGRLGAVLIDAPLRAGWHAAAFPESVPPGTYFVRMRTVVGRTTAMMVVTR
ncbi:MAG: hypothetical protein ACHQ52_05740 [Candidatus Eisenbacteria bacterium]